MDSGVQNPPGQPGAPGDTQADAHADARADESAATGLRALFRKHNPPGGPAAAPPSGAAARAPGSRPARRLAHASSGQPPAKPAQDRPAGNPAQGRPAGNPAVAGPGRPAGDPARPAQVPVKATAAGKPPTPPGQARPGSPGTQTGPRSLQPARRPLPTQPLVSRPLINPHLRADPRLRVWIIRTVLTVAVYLGFMIWHGWRVGVTAAAVYVIADVIYRSRTTSIVPAGVRVTSAQRFTSRRLKVLRAAGYLALNARSIPGTKHVIDHLVVGPAGIYAIDSQRMDKRLPLRMVGGMLFHGQRSLEKRLDHAQVEASLAAGLIGAELRQTVRVHPVVVTYGPSSMWKLIEVKNVALFDGSRIGSYFRQQSKQTRGHHLDSAQIAMIFAAAERALPPLR